MLFDAILWLCADFVVVNPAFVVSIFDSHYPESLLMEVYCYHMTVAEWTGLWINHLLIYGYF